MDKINNPEFVKMISKDTGYAQKEIAIVLSSVSSLLLRNLSEGKETAILKGVIVYPAKYKDKSIFPRARFGTYFKNFPSLS